MKLKFWLMPLMISTILISGCSLGKKVQTTTEDKYEYYQNKDYGFSFEYPSNWNQVSKFGVIIAFESPDEEKLLAPYAGIVQQPILDSNYNIKDFAKSAEKIFMRNNSYKVLSEGYMNIGNIEAYEITFDIDLFSYKYVYYYKDDSVFLLVLGALQSDFNQFKEKFDRIVKTYNASNAN